MELPGDFFVDSMDVALPWVMGLRWDEELLPLLIPRLVASPTAPGCVGSCHRECRCNRGPRVPEGARGFPHHPGEQDQAPLPAPGVMGAPQGGCWAPAQPAVPARIGTAPVPSGSSSATGATLFGRISFGLTSKCSSRTSKPEIKPKRAA